MLYPTDGALRQSAAVVVDRSTVLIKGRVVYDGLPQALRADTALMHRCVGV